MNALEFLIALRRRWRVIAIITAATMAVAWITTPGAKTQRQERTYQATQSLTAISLVRNIGNWDIWVSKATFGPVPREVASHFDAQAVTINGEKTARGEKKFVTFVTRDARAKATVTPDQVAAQLTIAVTSTNREFAQAIADDLANTLVAEIQSGYDSGYRNELKALQDKSAKFNADLDAAVIELANCPALDRRCRTLANSKVSGLRVLAQRTAGDINRKLQQGRKFVELRPVILDAAGASSAEVKVVPDAASSGIPTTAKPRLAAGLLLGLLLGALIAFLISRFDSAVYGIPATEAAARLPVLAEIPHVTTTRRRRFEVLTQLSPLSGVADSYRGLRTSIGLMWLANESESGQNEPRTLLVASPGPNEGKSTTSANLAAAYAEIGKRVIVVDLDFRRQRLHRFLGANAEPYLENTGSLSAPIVDLDAATQTTSIPGVEFIGSSSPDSTPAEAAVAGRAAILAAREIADIVIIDTPPLLLTNDTFDLLDLSDAVVLLARDAKTKSAALNRASQQLKRLDAPVVGIALIGAISSRPGYGYGYGYGYRYGYSYGYGYGSRTGVVQARKAAEGGVGTAGSDAAETAAVLDDTALVAAGPARKPGWFARRGKRIDNDHDGDEVRIDDNDADAE